MRRLPFTGYGRRRFLQTSLWALAGAGGWLHSAPARKSKFIETVLGPIEPDSLGSTLPHEHVMCDFIGAEQTGRQRWDVTAVVNRMRPFLRELKSRGVTGFVDCTPAYIGRDPRVLRALAQQTGLHILTNTGYYGGAGDKFVPPHAHQETADRLSARWQEEWKQGIEGTGVKPGFVKIGVDEVDRATGRLSSIDEKLVRAAARTSKQTGLAVVCHTGGGPAGLASTRIFIEEKANPARFIVAHSDRHGLPVNQEVAELGAWVSFDAISRQPLEEHLALVEAMIQRHADRLLLSHDNGWFWVGQENGGEVRDFNYLHDHFQPACRRKGISEATLRQLTVENPAQAFAIRE